MNTKTSVDYGMTIALHRYDHAGVVLQSVAIQSPLNGRR